MSEKRVFGPFVDVPTDMVTPAGFVCNHCRGPVERVAQVVPALTPRIIIYACRCGAVAVWEDEHQPDCRLWRCHVKLLREAKVDTLIFNGNKPTTTKFQGVN
jgi:hypothetical protein